MMKIRNFGDVATTLERYMPEHSGNNRYTLITMIELMKFLGNPQEKIRVIHIAGTSGKTSTTYYVASLLHAAGYRVGSSVSPHIDVVSERAQIDLTPLDEANYVQEFSEFIDLVGKSKLLPSYFELLVAFAYWLFAKREVDFAVMEVGLGGLLDATNVITRHDKVCVITDIGYDHMNVLGTTLPEIAAQKAGIIKPGNHVFMYDQGSTIVDVVKKACAAADASIEIVTQAPNVSADIPHFQQRNWHLALHAVQYATNVIISEDARQRSLDVTIPARMERVQYDGKLVILDGSHNEQKMNALVDSLRRQYPGKTIACLVSFGVNKREVVEPALAILVSVSDSVIVTSFSTGYEMLRPAIATHTLAEYAQEAGFSTVEMVAELREALTRLLAQQADIYLVTGSFYLVAHLRPIVLKQN